MFIAKLAASGAIRHRAKMEKKDVRIQLVMSPAELVALDAWRQKHAVWSRSAAIRKAIAKMVDEDGKHVG